jgi:hypothetical protein
LAALRSAVVLLWLHGIVPAHGAAVSLTSVCVLKAFVFSLRRYLQQVSAIISLIISLFDFRRPTNVTGLIISVVVFAI